MPSTEHTRQDQHDKGQAFQEGVEAGRQGLDVDDLDLEQRSQKETVALLEGLAHHRLTSSG